MNENTATQPVVELKDGALMGRIKDAVYLFSGIPYAAPPVGAARFKAAQPVQPWEGIRDATKFGPAAPQIPSGGMTDRVPVRWDEDCLTLNVATPSVTGGEERRSWSGFMAALIDQDRAPFPGTTARVSQRSAISLLSPLIIAWARWALPTYQALQKAMKHQA